MIEALRDRLQELHALTAQTPLYNPVFQLGLELSRDLEAGKISLADLGALVNRLEQETLHDRAATLRGKLAPIGHDDNLAAFRIVAEAGGSGFAAFARKWSHPILHTVFTGHPTFLLTEAQSDGVAQAIQSDGGDVAMPASDGPRPPITLADEHRQALAALRNGQFARDALVRVLFDVAAEKWPQDWRDLKPMPFRFATWIGYDMDGRTDLNWQTNINFRLKEKAERLASYAGAARMLGLEEVTTRLEAAATYSSDMAARFEGELDDPKDLSEAANAFTAAHPDKLLSLDPIIELLEERSKRAELEDAKGILTLAASMRADGLGMGWIHFRMNSSQLHNAVRNRIDPENVLDLAGGTAMSLLRDHLKKVKPLRSNFAALAIETTTALRQFITMAQILHHIDADTPIRLLIAECEEPQTVMAALYFAKLFGIDDKVDVSPLFETQTALEHGGRFLDALLAEPIYRDYARRRGRVAIQTGYSDAGRFVGQIPAALALERLEGRLARAMEKNGLDRVSALVFNTHGESMGRGGYPGSMVDRLTWPMSHWARDQFARRAVPLEMEASFQGGDGFLYFKAPNIALATLTRIAEAHFSITVQEADPFYERTDISLDFYRSIRTVQTTFLEWRAYARAITAFGLSLLNQTGSRKSRRQSDLAAEREMGLRQIRAIPHNAILQQLGYPINIIAGVGTASGEETDLIASVLAESVRGKQIVGLLRAANRIASIKTVAAYGELFNSAYWASRPYRGMEQHLSHACLSLAERLESDDRAGEYRRLASRLRVDGTKLHSLLALLPEAEKDEGREVVRRSLGVLHAVRLALIQHMFLHVVQVPAFARSNDISRDDVINMVFALRTEEAVAQLRRAYPVSAPELTDFSVAEPSDYPDNEGQPYSEIRTRLIDPIEQADQIVRQISSAIANVFGAFG
ncbi:MAG TPA: phosphoenolpyruvate carboxylase [Sphingobium sp.]|uniref:phosphoenolpyruvate carboxylase n=1 Tax=Sphingobium sp. TaxID=1912891 RepID=UPI002ED4A321